ncbi:MAG TPA: META domain-containing protein [Bryobacteraceae bacterium]|nr:META domain-containing protein [Bryobacteraceae bacterium]
MLRLSISIALVFVLLGTSSMGEAQDQTTTLTGTLTRIMAIGGESSGWAMQLNPGFQVGDKKVDSIEVDSSNRNLLENLANKRVNATGSFGLRRGVETGMRLVFNISSGREASKSSNRASSDAILVGTEWLLEDLAGRGVVGQVPATLSFKDAGQISGRGSCNGFSGTAQIQGNTIKLGPLIATKRACADPAMMNQENQYLRALQSAEHFELQGDTLLVYSAGEAKPLRFRRKP